MNILVACEESQVVCSAFRSYGHNAFSCDLVPCSGGFPEWHILQDCLPLINGFCSFYTCDGVLHTINSEWDMIIAFPPCTYLTKASSVRLFPGGVLDSDRYQKGLAARDFFLSILNCNCSRICIENPTPLSIFNLPLPSQIIEPYYFGHPYSKRTLLWLKGLPILFYTDIVSPDCSWVSSSSRYPGLQSSQKLRSRTFSGVAAAMASQWNF